MSERVDIKAVWPDWEIEKRIGSGSFGSVYRAKKTVGETVVYSAVKVISIPFEDSEVASLAAEGLSVNDSIDYYRQLTDDIVKEVSFMESCKGNTNIVGIEDFKVVEQPNAPHYDIFIRMELLTPLNTYLCDKTLDEKEVIKLGIDLCNALTICEKKNIIHRDIKPENIFVNVFGDYKLGDFGIARSLEGMTFGFSQKGTFNYMAPEVFNSSFYDFRADIYSLGIVLYRLLNRNRLPFLDNEKQLLSPSERRYAVERRLKGDAIPPIKGVSPELSDIIIKACSYKPEDRFASAAAMKEALESLSGKDNATDTSEDKASKRNLWLKILVPLCVLLLAANVALGILILSDNQSKSVPEATTVSLTEKDPAERAAMDKLNAERARIYSTARNYEKTGQFRKAYNEYDRLVDYMNAEEHAVNIANYLKCFGKKQFGAAAEYIRVINPDDYSPALVEEYEKLADAYKLSRQGYYNEAKEILDGLNLIYSYEKHSFEVTCLFEYILWLDHAEIVDDIPSLLTWVMNEEDWIYDNWGSGFSDRAGDNSYYIYYANVGADKTADIRVFYNDDSLDFTEYTFNTETTDDAGRIVRHYFDIAPDGKPISSYKTVDGEAKTFVPKDTRVNVPAIEKEEKQDAQDLLDEANALISKGRANEAGPLLLDIVDGFRYAEIKCFEVVVEDGYYKWDDKYYTKAKQYWTDGHALFSVFFEDFKNDPVGFAFRYDSGKEVRFYQYDMQGNFMGE